MSEQLLQYGPAAGRKRQSSSPGRSLELLCLSDNAEVDQIEAEA